MRSQEELSFRAPIIGDLAWWSNGGARNLLYHDSSPRLRVSVVNPFFFSASFAVKLFAVKKPHKLPVTTRTDLPL